MFLYELFYLGRRALEDYIYDVEQKVEIFEPPIKFRCDRGRSISMTSAHFSSITSRSFNGVQLTESEARLLYFIV
jgi:hypothetical protein